MLFNIKKATQALCILLIKEGGRMNYMKAIKELYIADREALGQWGNTITGDSHVSMKHGPVLSNILDLINNGGDPKISPYWKQHISAPENYKISVLSGGNCESDELSQREIKLLGIIQERFAEQDEWKMVDYCHQNLKEWEDPSGSSLPITPEKILKALGKSENEINQIIEKIETVDHAKKLLIAE